MVTRMRDDRTPNGSRLGCGTRSLSPGREHGHGGEADLLPRTAQPARPTRLERPSGRPLAAACSLAAAGLALGLGTALDGRRKAGLRALGSALAAGSALSIAAPAALGGALVRGFLRRPAEEPLSADDELVGAYLARGLDEFPHTAFSRALDEGERQAVDANRRAEAGRLRAWLRESGVRPRVVHMRGGEGMALAAHVIEANPGSGKWVVTAHGFRGTWGEHLVHARRYAQAGWNLLMPDLRGGGMSAGELVGMGWLERRDLVAWARWLVEREGEEVRIVFHGHSMGGAAVCLAAAEPDLPAQVLAGISDCSYSDVWNLARYLAREGAHLPPHPALEIARLLLEREPGGYDIARADAVGGARRARIPLLVVHGEKDSFIPPWMAREIYAVAPVGSELLLVPHAGHCQSALADPDGYYRVLSGFLGRHIP